MGFLRGFLRSGFGGVGWLEGLWGIGIRARFGRLGVELAIVGEDLKEKAVGLESPGAEDGNSNGLLDEVQIASQLDAILSYPQVMAPTVLFSLSWIPCVLEGGYLA